LTAEVEKEKKMSVRPYVMMPYLASILLVATTVMMMSFTTGFGATTSSVSTAASTASKGLMQTIFMTAVIFNSYIIGIVAGKISEESISAGFKHSAILVVIACLAATLIPLFIKL
jgi:flagellar protein FlaJ